MKVIEKNDEIILRDVPVSKWIFGVFLLLCVSLAAFLFAYDVFKYPYQTFQPHKGSKIILNIVVILLGCVGLWIGLRKFFLDLSVQLIITRIKPKQLLVEIEKWTLFSKHSERFYFSQIKSFDIDEIYDEKSRKISANVLTLVNKSKIALESSEIRYDDKLPLRIKLNEILKKANSANSKKRGKIKRKGERGEEMS